MNLTHWRRGVTLSTRVTSREVQLEMVSARVQTLACAERHAIRESDRAGQPLVYEVKGHNLSGPLRKPAPRKSLGQRGKKTRSRLCREAPSRVGTFLIVGGGMVRRQTNRKGWGGIYKE